MPRPANPDVRRALIERAAEMLSRREPVTLRSLVGGTGVSTMAVYTHFDGMPGLWRAVRQEGFTRLDERLAAVEPTGDAVYDLVALGAAYMANALTHPDLYRAMFDAHVDLNDQRAADDTFATLVVAATRARDQGRFTGTTAPEAVATRSWAMGHGLTMLAITGVLPSAAVVEHMPPMVAALFIEAGDDPARCWDSVTRAWADHPVL